MPSFYWIKLWCDLLDQAKYATMPDRLWRRHIELVLLAGRHNKGGHLPDTMKIAWELRLNPVELEHDLEQLESIGGSDIDEKILVRTQDGWLLTKFADRQAAAPVKDRVKRYRERNEKVTLRYEGGNVIPIEEKRGEESREEERRGEEKKEELDLTAASLWREFGNIFGKKEISQDEIVILNRMTRSGVEAKDIKQAYSELIEKNYNPSGIAGLERAVMLVYHRRTWKRSNVKLEKTMDEVDWAKEIADHPEIYNRE